MPYIDVDTAVELFVNSVPLTDDTDFKTREIAVAYNAAGMDLVWNFITTAGVITQTAVTPTTAGSYDWTHVGDGMYKIEVPATGGASINNNTEGTGWFSGVATGVLPWVSPLYTFRPAAVNNALVDGTAELEVNTTKVSGKAPPICTGTANTGGSTTSITTSAFTPAPNSIDQFVGRIVIFDNDTTTAALRGHAASITASTNASTPTLTVSTMPDSPVSGDTFRIY
jgi:hypothetical protein